MMSRDVKIVITGPESTGKTSLAQALAAELGVRWAPEFARTYLSCLGRSYERADLDRMAAGQLAWEAWYQAQFPGMLVCDTDWTVFQIWDDFKYACPPGGEMPDYAALIAFDRLRFYIKNIDKENYTHYFLCYPDFEWEPDPLREHPEQRMELYAWYRALLEAARLPFTVLKGDPSIRLQDALAVVRNF